MSLQSNSTLGKDSRDTSLDEFKLQVRGVKPRIVASWVNVNGVPVQEGATLHAQSWSEVLSSGKVPDLDCLCLRNPEYFIDWGLHHSLEAWDLVFQEDPLRDSISDWIKNKVDIFTFSQPFTGVYKKVRYSSILPPQKQFRNHVSCNNFNEFISNEVINRVRTGAFRVWGEVDVDDPPHLVLPFRLL